MTREELNRRRDDIETAVNQGQSYAWLAARWGIAHCTAHQWVSRNATDDELAALRATGFVAMQAWRCLGDRQEQSA